MIRLDNDTRGKALALFTLAPFAGPSLGPTVSGFMAVSGVSWRWVFWVQTIFAGVSWAAMVVSSRIKGQMFLLRQ